MLTENVNPMLILDMLRMARLTKDCITVIYKTTECHKTHCLTFNRVCNNSNTTVVTNGVGTSYLSES